MTSRLSDTFEAKEAELKQQRHCADIKGNQELISLLEAQSSTARAGYPTFAGNP
jgi:hypothetical protein